MVISSARSVFENDAVLSAVSKKGFDYSDPMGVM